MSLARSFFKRRRVNMEGQAAPSYRPPSAETPVPSIEGGDNRPRDYTHSYNHTLESPQYPYHYFSSERSPSSLGDMPSKPPYVPNSPVSRVSSFSDPEEEAEFKRKLQKYYDEEEEDLRRLDLKEKARNKRKRDSPAGYDVEDLKEDLGGSGLQSQASLAISDTPEAVLDLVEEVGSILTRVVAARGVDINLSDGEAVMDALDEYVDGRLWETLTEESVGDSDFMIDRLLDTPLHMLMPIVYSVLTVKGQLAGSNIFI